MANHVYFTISIDASEKVQNSLREIMSVAYEESERNYGDGDSFTVREWSTEKLPIFEEPYKEDDWYSWGCDNVGAKWCHIEDYDDYDTISGHSAWSHPHALVVNLLRTLAEANPEERISCNFTYEDEFRNFFGVTFFEAHYEPSMNNHFMDIDECYYESEEFIDLLREKFPNIDDEDYDWWELDEDTDLVPQEYADEVVYQTFTTGRLEHYG